MANASRTLAALLALRFDLLSLEAALERFQDPELAEGSIQPELESLARESGRDDLLESIRDAFMALADSADTKQPPSQSEGAAPVEALSPIDLNQGTTLADFNPSSYAEEKPEANASEPDHNQPSSIPTKQNGAAEDAALQTNATLFSVSTGGEAQSSAPGQTGAQQAPSATGGRPESIGEAPTVAAVPGESAAAGAARRSTQSFSAHGRYAIQREHARGGMGRILVALDQVVGREVALKELLPSRGTSHTGSSSASEGRSRMLERFLREAKITGQLEHPNIVPVYEIGERADGSAYYTMKFVHGRSLEERLNAIQANRELDANAKLKERLKLVDAFIDVCDAMSYAHAKGVVHRDLKPANVMCGDYGETLVLDWGIARVLNNPASANEESANSISSVVAATPEAANSDADALDSQGAALTLTGSVVGTPAYMPPEQAQGEISAIDAQSDVYALGATLYHILTKQPPYRGTNASHVLRDVLSSEPKPVRELEEQIPPELEALTSRAMARSKSLRLKSARELGDELRAWRAGRMLTTYNYTPLARARHFIAQNAKIVSTVAVALLVLMTLATYSYFSIRSERQNALQARDEAMASAQRSQQAEARADRDAAAARQALSKAQTHLAQVHREKAGLFREKGQFHEALVHLARAHQIEPESVDKDDLKRTALACNPMIWQHRSGLGPAGARYVPSPSGRVLALQHYDAPLELWDSVSGEMILRKPLGDAHDACSQVCFSRDGKRLAALNQVGDVLYLFDFDGENLSLLSKHTLSRHCFKLKFNHSGALIILHSWDEGLSILDWQRGIEEALPDSSQLQPNHALAFTTGDLKLEVIYAHSSGELVRWRSGESQPTTLNEELFPSSSESASLCYLPEDESIWFCTVEGISVLDRSGQILRKIPLDDPAGDLMPIQGGKRAVIVQGDWESSYTTSIIDATSGKRLHQLSQSKIPLEALQPINDAQGVFLIGMHHAEAFSTQTGQPLTRLGGFSQSLITMTAALDGSTLAALHESGTIHVLNAKSGEVIHVWNDQRDTHDLVFTPDGRHLVLIKSSGELLYRNTQTGSDAKRANLETQYLETIHFSPCARLLAVLSDFGDASLYNAATHEWITQLSPANGGDAECLQFLPDGSELLIGTSTGLLRYSIAEQRLLPFDLLSNYHIRSICMQDDLIAIGTDTGSVHVFQRYPIDGSIAEILRKEVFSGAVISLAPEAPGRFFAVGGTSSSHERNEQGIKLVDCMNEGSVQPKASLPEDAKMVHTCRDGGALFVAASSGTISAHRAAVVRPLGQLHVPATLEDALFAQSQDGRTLAVRADNNMLFVYTLQSDTAVLKHRIELPEFSTAYALAVSNGGKHVLISGNQIVEGAEDYDEVFRFLLLTIPAAENAAPKLRYLEAEIDVAYLNAFDASGRYAAFGGGERLAIFDLEAERWLDLPDTPAHSYLASLRVGAQDGVFCTINGDGEVYAYQATQHALLHLGKGLGFVGASGGIAAEHHSPGLFHLKESGEAVRYHSSGSQASASYRGLSFMATGLCVSFDDRFLVAGSEDAYSGSAFSSIKAIWSKAGDPLWHGVPLVDWGNTWLSLPDAYVFGCVELGEQLTWVSYHDVAAVNDLLESLDDQRLLDWAQAFTHLQLDALDLAPSVKTPRDHWWLPNALADDPPPARQTDALAGERAAWRAHIRKSFDDSIRHQRTAWLTDCRGAFTASAGDLSAPEISARQDTLPIDALKPQALNMLNSLTNKQALKAGEAPDLRAAFLSKYPEQDAAIRLLLAGKALPEEQQD